MKVSTSLTLIVLVLCLLLKPSQGAILVLSVSNYAFCIASNFDVTYGITCSPTTKATLIQLQIPMGTITPASAISVDLNSKNGAVEPANIFVSIEQPMVWRYSLGFRISAPIYYELLSDCGDHYPSANGCTGTMASDSQCVSGYCSATSGSITNMYNTAAGNPDRSTYAYTAVLPPSDGGPFTSTCCQGTCGRPGICCNEMFWISPIYNLFLTTKQGAYYRVKIEIIRASDSASEVLLLTPDAPLGTTGDGLVGAQITDVGSITASSQPDAPEVYGIPKDTFFDNELQFSVPDPYVNPRAGKSCIGGSPNYQLPYWWADVDLSAYHISGGTGCGQNGINQAWGCSSSTPIDSCNTGVCANLGACVPGSGAIGVHSSIMTNLQSRFGSYSTCQQPVLLMPTSWLSGKPNMWIYNSGGAYTLYMDNGGDITGFNVKVALVVSGDFLQEIIGVSSGSLVPVASGDCVFSTLANTGTVTVNVKNTGSGAGTYTLVVNCSDIATTPQTQTLTLSGGATSNLNPIILATSSPIGTYTCNAYLYSQVLTTLTLLDSMQISCTVTAANTPPPISPPGGTPPPGGPPSTGADGCPTLTIFPPSTAILKALWCKLIGPLKIVGILILVCCICCCCCSSLLSCVFLGPTLLGALGAARVAGNGADITETIGAALDDAADRMHDHFGTLVDAVGSALVPAHVHDAAHALLERKTRERHERRRARAATRLDELDLMTAPPASGTRARRRGVQTML